NGRSWPAATTGTRSSSRAKPAEPRLIRKVVYWRTRRRPCMYTEMKRTQNLLLGLTFLALLVALGVTEGVLQKSAAAQEKNTVQAPRYEVDPMWPKPLPNHWLLGNAIGVGVDSRDHVYIIHRGAATLDRKEIYAAQNPP